jgi:hypothetical protein
MADITWIAAPVAVLVSGALGWWASQRTIQHQLVQKERENEARKRLVFQLLRDEIELRWKGEIERYLRGLLDRDPIDGLERFAAMELKGDDVFAFKAVSASFVDYFFIGNVRLVSQIVHGYLLVCDLIDFRSFVARTFAERRITYQRLRLSLSEEETQQRLSQEYEDDIAKFWKDLSSKLDAIRKRFDEILAQLG